MSGSLVAFLGESKAVKPHIRAAIAAASISHHLNRQVSSIYDFTTKGYRSIEASFSGSSLSGYDYDQSAHFDGSMPDLYHYGESSFIEFKVKAPGMYEGYDFGASHFYEVKVKPNGEAELYDYGSGGFFSYSL
jgi:hypothetical protein